MIVIGLGANSSATADDISAAISAAEAAAGCRATQIAVFEGAHFAPALEKARETAAASLVRVPLSCLKARSDDCHTRSERSLERFGVASISEASALVAAGERSRLIVPRLVCGPVTAAVAIAVNEAEPSP